ncbi:nitrite reductase small subunit NirD [Herbiconiux sp. P16]|uniref:nitrite reductase small subunit NirD n=1 Tax=Herbiconiux wuyangfengii TaxID=3342794 RepID=UPI0035B90CB7
MTLLDTGIASHADQDDRWVAVCRRDQLEPLWGEAALVDGAQLALFLLPDGRVFAVSNADPATGAFVMSRGIVGSRGDRATIASPLHKAVFDLETGACLSDSALRLPTWRVRDRGGRIEVARAVQLLAVSHGTSDPAGQTAVAELVEAVRAAHPELPVSAGFVDVQQPDVAASLESIAAPAPVAIVPLLLSAGYHVHVDLADAARAAEHTVAVASALGPDVRLATVLARRLREAGLRDDDHVVLGAAGSTDAVAVADCYSMAELLAIELAREVRVGFISAASPTLPDAVAAARTSGRASDSETPEAARVVIATYLLAPGYFAALARAAGADVTSEPLLGAGPPPPELVDLVVDRYRSALPQPAAPERTDR